MLTPAMSKRVFVSYSDKQGQWVWERLVPILRAAGCAEVLIERERFRAGRGVKGQIKDHSRTPLSLLNVPACLALLALATTTNAADRYVSLQGGHVPPFTNWVDAATNIQAAIDTAAAGDVIWVTNGTYAIGGKVMAGDLTNRVALDKALTVQSVNGPAWTTIQGNSATNGTSTVRCAWLTNQAVIRGFTIQGGGPVWGGDYSTIEQGGGVWCASSSAMVVNCVIRTNAGYYGGAVYQGTLKNCAVIGNTTYYGSCCGCTLVGCTVVGNWGYGLRQCKLTNCVVYFHTYPKDNGLVTYDHCCTTPPLPTGIGNITDDPQLLADSIHLAAMSPCRYAGSASAVSGTDIDGQPWSTPPAIGCDEWQPAPVVISNPRIQLTTPPFKLSLSVSVVAQDPYTCRWTRDGTPIEDDGHFSSVHTTNLVANAITGFDTGAYQMVVSNAFGMATSSLAQVVFHFVDASAAGPVTPFSSWATAATNIQGAIDAALPGEIVLVTNGVYAAGGRAMAGDLTNRVVLDKTLTVQSVNGPFVTTIQGNGATPGFTAVRCVWLTNGASLSGFTIRDGATRAAGDELTLQSGGGGWCASTNAVVANCVIVGNAAKYGGGVFKGTINNCFLTGNKASYTGGGAYQTALNNCTVTSNSFGGFYAGTANNCILYFNSPYNWASASGSSQSYCCTTPSSPGVGNTSADPQLLNGVYLANSSRCRAAGTNRVSGVDLYGQPWGNPPAIGCAEWQSFPLVTQPKTQLITAPPGFTISSSIAGHEPAACYWMLNGVQIEEGGHFTGTRTTNLVAVGVHPLDVGSYQLVVSNAFGMATSAVAQVVAHYVDAAGTASMTPYTTWATAATDIQDAINAALPGEIVFVTNGVYATGGKVMAGDLTNRVAVDKAILVQSINGSEATIIEGSGATNGSAAVRCAWLTNGAALRGFTLRGGATRTGGDAATLRNGGGVWGASTNATLFNCVLTTNNASYSGGGAYQITLKNCAVVGNCTAASGYGGGAAACNMQNCRLSWNASSYGGGTYSCNLQNCALTSNTGYSVGSAAYSGTLVNCTLANNFANVTWPTFVYGVTSATLYNCIVSGNNYVSGSAANYSSCTFGYCCTTPLPAGVGNMDADPQLLEDGIHLASASPCRGVGTNIVQGTDIDGQPWANPPSMGCDEWLPAPIIAIQPRTVFTEKPGSLGLGLVVAGQAPFICQWSKDGSALNEGAHSGSANNTNLVVRGLGPDDAGIYQVVVSNAFGVVPSQVVQVVVRCVDAAGSHPAPPYTNWPTAATNIQDAIDAAAAGDVILVTNGVYASGGRVMERGLTNRVAMYKPLAVLSVNGPMATTIRGQRDPVSVIGPAAVRCAWLTNGAALNGFTLTGGATTGFGFESGGGVWCASTVNSLVVNCLIVSNTATGSGGGTRFGRLINCAIVGNRANFNSGGGAVGGHLSNCTLVGNYSAGFGGGTLDASLTNCIVYFNSTASGAWDIIGGYAISCCSPNVSSNYGSIASDPQLVDTFHLAATSPCRGMGKSLGIVGADLDGDDWLNPPSIGCDEVVEAAFSGLLAVAIEAAQTNLLVNHALALTGRITGRAARLTWEFGDGPTITNASYITSHAWTNAGDYTVTFTAFNTDTPAGVATNLQFHVLPINQPVVTAGWATGTNFQFQFTGQADANYWVQYATNLAPPITWLTLTSLTGTGGVVQISDTAVTNAARFYRVRAQ